jgi:uncharacterized DUF497 family protein
MSLVFEWDNRKARSNLEKHRVGFVESVSVFNDPLARIFADTDRPVGELREIVIGHSSATRLLVVSRRRNAFASSAHGSPQEESNTIMKKTSQVKAGSNRADALRPEYHFDYRKPKPHRFAGKTHPESVAVLLDPDVAQFFEGGESVNTLLRALMTALSARRGPTAR